MVTNSTHVNLLAFVLVALVVVGLSGKANPSLMATIKYNKSKTDARNFTLIVEHVESREKTMLSMYFCIPDYVHKKDKRCYYYNLCCLNIRSFGKLGE